MEDNDDKILNYDPEVEPAKEVEPPRYNLKARFWVLVAAVFMSLMFAFSTIFIIIRSNRAEAISAQNLGAQIQRERERSVRTACEEQNSRHDNTIKTLNDLIAKLPPDRKAEAEANKAGTVILLDAIAPHRDCDALVKSVVPTGSPKQRSLKSK